MICSVSRGRIFRGRPRFLGSDMTDGELIGRGIFLGRPRFLGGPGTGMGPPQGIVWFGKMDLGRPRFLLISGGGVRGLIIIGGSEEERAAKFRGAEAIFCSCCFWDFFIFLCKLCDALRFKRLLILIGGTGGCCCGWESERGYNLFRNWLSGYFVI